MPLSLKDVVKGKSIEPPIICVFGAPGIGKTTFAAGARNPIFLATEDGAGVVGPARFNIETFEEFQEALQLLKNDKHDYQTIVVDSLDWLQPLVWDYVCRKANQPSIEAFGYGKGYNEATAIFRNVFLEMREIKKRRKMSIIMLAHMITTTKDFPDRDSYSTNEIKLHKGAAGLIQEYADLIGFADLKTIITREDKGFNRKVAKATSDGTRVLRVNAHPAYVAKSRYPMPNEIPLEYPVLEKHILGEAE